MFDFCFGRCYCQWFWATWCYWQMLLPCCLWVCNLCFYFGWCYCQLLCFLYGRWWCCSIWLMFVLADVIGICFVVVGITTLIISCTKRYTTVVVSLWQMLLPGWLMVLPCGWCFHHYFVFLFCWQMLLPGGWCFCHYYVVLFCWQMLLPGGWWNAHHGCGWQMLLPKWQMDQPLGQCFNFKSEFLCRTPSHMWGRWYLPMFLFRDGSLTLMNRASYCSGEVLVLPSNYGEIIDDNFMTWDVTMVMNRRGGLLVFFEPLCKGSCRLSNVFFFTTFVSVDAYNPKINSVPEKIQLIYKSSIHITFVQGGCSV